MSDSSISSAGNERIAARLRLMAPGGRWEIFQEDAGDTEGLDAFCVVSGLKPAEISGYALIGTKQHRVPEKLGDVVAKLLRERGLPSWLGSLCRPQSMVGSRICQTAVPGLSNHFYQLEELASSASPAGDRVCDVLCSVVGLGHLPLVGATAASFATCLFAWALMFFSGPETWRFLLLLVCVFASAACLLLEKWAHRHYLAEDPREVVLDEVAGMALALAIAGPGLWTIAAAFFAFRFFDIFKLGIHWIEKRGWRGTIVWDDLLAGIYAAALVCLGCFLLPM